jgi:two-component system chemotaxis sensor kinase CheA
MERFRQVFFDESAEALDTIEQHLLNIDLDDVSDEVVNDIFRSAHSLKGGSATFGMNALAEFTHSMETLLDIIREGEKQFNQNIVDCLFECMDCLRNLINHYQIDEAINTAQIDSVMAKLQSLIEGDSEAGSHVESETLASSVANEGKKWQIEFAPHEHILMSGNEPLSYIKELEDLGETSVKCLTEAVPELDQLSPTSLLIKWDIELNAPAMVSRDDLDELFTWIEDDADLAFSCLDGEVILQVTAPEPEQQQDVVQTTSAEPLKAKQTESAGKTNTKAAGKKSTQSIRVELQKIDSLINLLGELVITQSMLSTFNDVKAFPQLQRLQEGLNQLERHTRDLQDGVMQIRMLPIDFCFSRFPRMVRDLCKQLDKDIEIQIVGEATEVDKTVIEELTDPLVHLIRNSIDHGIETPDVREAKSKNRTGTLQLKAFHQVGNIVIEIADDGQGLQVDRIRQKAIEKGVISETDKLSDQAVRELIFAPGFSTADSVTDLSGRGVGMDVVRRNIQSIGGHIEVRSEVDVGTTFSIRLPLTLAILDGQLVRVGGETYIIPMLAIIESIQISTEELNQVGKQHVSLKWRNELIPLLDLKETFVCPASSETEPEKLLVVIVEHDKQHYGLIVDELANHQQIVVKSLESNYVKVDELSGATILGDGSVALIIDVGALTQRARVH